MSLPQDKPERRRPTVDNERTRIVPTGFRSTLEPVLLGGDAALSAAARARDLDRARYAILVVASWLDGAGRPQLRSWLREGETPHGPIAVSVGAHSESDVGPIVGASLRHVLLIADPARRGPLLEVVDLCSAQGFRADGAEGVRHVETLVPQRLGVGSADLVALVLTPGEGVHDAWARAQRLDVLAGGPKRRTGASAVVRAVQARCEVSVQQPHPLRTTVDLRSDARALADRLQPPTREGLTRVVGEPAADGTVRVRAPAAELARGVLIGRDDRCSAGRADHLMSRVHAWVRTRGDGLLVADAGSTNGTTVVQGAEAIALDRGARALVVPGARVTLVCGETHVVIERADG